MTSNMLYRILYKYYPVTAFPFILTLFTWRVLRIIDDSRPSGQISYAFSDEEVQYRRTTTYKEITSQNRTKIKEALRSKDLSFLFRLAKDYSERGYTAEAIDLLNKIIEIDPNGRFGQQATEEVIKL